MMHGRLTAFALAFALAGGAARAADLADYAPAPEREEGEIYACDFNNPDLEAGGWGMTVEGEFAVERNCGRSDGPGLRIERRNPAYYAVLGHPVKLKPGGAYELSFWVKTENIEGAGLRAGIEFYHKDADGNSEYLFPTTYSQGVVGTTDWHKVVLRAPRVPDRANYAAICLFLAKNTKGVAWVDDVSLRPAEPTLHAIVTSPAYQTIAPGQSMRVLFCHDNGAVFPDDDGVARLAHAQIEGRPDTAVFAPIAESAATLTLPVLPEGRYTLILHALDDTNRRRLARRVIPLAVRAAPALVSFDENGVARVAGEKYMPLGFYANAPSQKVIDLLKDCGGNVVMPYCSMSMDEGRGLPKWREILDRLDEHGMKILFSLKDLYPGVWDRPGDDPDALSTRVVEGLRGHPALLGWYVNDELTFAPMLARRRDLVNRLDPEHPTWTVNYQVDELPLYARGGDALGLMCYPVSKRPPARTEIASANLAGLRQAVRIGAPFWAVPQIHNVGLYKNEKERADYRSPLEREMRAMSLLYAGEGAKGFVFYMIDDLWSDKAPADNFETQWPRVRAVFELLRELEPFILSDTRPQRLPLDVKQGKARAYRLKNGDDERLLFVALGPGDTEAVFTLPDANAAPAWTSRFGLTQKENNTLVFRAAEGLDADVLDHP